MLVKNTTPFFHATVVTSRRPPQPEMVLVVRGTFRLVHDGVVEVIEALEQGFLCGDRFADDDEARSGALVSPSDLSDYKLNAEVMLIGRCHPPKGRATACPVRFTVGDWKKELMVYGERRWEIGAGSAAPGEPAAFESMPLDYAHAFGGPGHELNPVGAGHGDDARVPNAELVSEPIQYRDSASTPASYAPINPRWPQRARYVGTHYGGDYRKKRAPYYADDHDWRHFSAAPADQQLTGFLRGDEKLVLQNLHPETPVMSTRLPGLRLRAYLKDESGAVRAIGMSLDTLLCEPEERTVKLTWRGLVEVKDDDFDDVTHVLIASEKLEDKPKGDAHYHALLADFERDPTGVMAALPPELLEEHERLQKKRRGEPVPLREVDPTADPLTAQLDRSFGKLLAPEQRAKIAASMAQIESQRSQHMPQLDLASRLAAVPDAADIPPTMRHIKPGTMPDAGLAKRMRLISNAAADLRKQEREIGKPIPGIDKIEAIPHEPKWKELDPAYEPPGPLSSDEPGPGADLRERDFTGQDWTGKNLRGANLERAELTRACLRGADLTGANLKHAVLYQADLADAKLDGADLSLCNAAYVRALGARFDGATLNEACFEQAVLEGASLDGVTGEYVVFEGANLRNVSAKGARFDHSDFSSADLEGAKLRQASLTLCLFAGCSARKLDLTDATAEQASFVAADLSEASFVRARAPRAFLMRAKLDGADFGLADLTSAHLTKASAKRGRFYGCNLKGARLYRADLERAQLLGANLMSSDLCKSHVEGASFAGANLYDAKLVDLRGGGVDFTDATLDRAVTKEGVT